MKPLLFAFALALLANSCIKPARGCMDGNSFNYNPDATEDDGSCIDMAGCLGWLPNATQSGQVISSFGNAQYDAKFSEEVALQSMFYEEIPTDVGILLEPSVEKKNAFASSDGYILFGYHLFHETLYNFGELPLAGILAHEWGHRTQQELHWQDYSQPAHRELEADAFSGFYLFLAKQWAWSRVDQYYTAIMAFGDYNFNSPYHHGTPNERLAAARLGVEVAEHVVQNNQMLTYADLHEIFNTYIQSEIKPRDNHPHFEEIEFPSGLTFAHVKPLFPKKSK